MLFPTTRWFDAAKDSKCRPLSLMTPCPKLLTSIQAYSHWCGHWNCWPGWLSQLFGLNLAYAVELGLEFIPGWIEACFSWDVTNRMWVLMVPSLLRTASWLDIGGKVITLLAARVSIWTQHLLLVYHYRSRIMSLSHWQVEVVLSSQCTTNFVKRRDSQLTFFHIC